MSAPFRIASAADVPQPALHAAFLAAFDGYVAGTPDLPYARWGNAMARQGVSFPLSRVALDAQDQVLAFALVAPRRDAPRWRLAVMGAVPAARGLGAAPALLDDLLARASAAGQQAAELECFAQNPRALALYTGRGFAERHALRSYTKAPPHDTAADGAGAAVREVGIADALEWLAGAARAIDDLPLQVTAPSIAGLEPAGTVWQLGTAQVIFTAVGADRWVVHSFVDLDPAQRDAERLMRHLCAAAGARTIAVPPLQRDDVGGAALQRAGFEVRPLHQMWMVRML
ncbi:MAG: GNAT family N-acetyltransferase [Rubrivivax sp.]|nr:GNAT family N-acetyltransferase [Rubrivivax sp.]